MVKLDYVWGAESIEMGLIIVGPLFKDHHMALIKANHSKGTWDEAIITIFETYFL